MTTSGAEPARAVRPWRRRGGLVTLSTVACLAVGIGLTVNGLGTADQALASFDAARWSWSRAKGEMARINGVTSRVDTRVDVGQSRGHHVQISQSDRFAILRDLTTGQVSSMDLTSLQVAATMPTTAGLGVSVALQDDAAFVIDAVQGVVRQLDPRTLTPIGPPIQYPPGITGGVFDGDDQLWVAVPGEGTVSAITPAPLPSAPGPATDAGAGGDGAPGPRLVKTLPVAPPSHDLTLSALDAGVAVLNRTTNALTTIRDEEQNTVTLPLPGPGTLPPRTNGRAVTVTVPDARRIYVVTDQDVRDFQVPGSGARLRPAVSWNGYVYCADEQTGTVHVFDAGGKPTEAIKVKNSGGPVELEVRENYLFINAPDASTARVVDGDQQVREVDKYPDDVLGGDLPKASAPAEPRRSPPSPKVTDSAATPQSGERPTRPTRSPKASKPSRPQNPQEPALESAKPEPEKPQEPEEPEATRPGAPQDLRAEAGNAAARLSWQPAEANGAPIVRYVVVGAGRTFQVGADQRSLEVTGLINGETYEFTVHAVNDKGDGPQRTTNPVRPTAEVPSAPAQVTAQAGTDGSVRVSWTAADGGGLAVSLYAVTAVSAGSNAPIGESTGTELVIPDGQLEYGRQYAFSVVAVNERGAGSPGSPLSATVVPFTRPGRPENVSAATVEGRPGTVRVRWGPAGDNGRPITKYVVRAGGRTTEVTDGGRDVELSGFGDGQDVSVEVVGVNEAGEGRTPGTATARTVARPTIRVTGSTATATSMGFGIDVDAGGGRLTCWLTVDGGRRSGDDCSNPKITGLRPDTAYTFTIHASNAAGETTQEQRKTTESLKGTATCTVERECAEKVSLHDQVPRQGAAELVTYVRNGADLTTFCKTSGPSVTAAQNGNKQSTVWIRVRRPALQSPAYVSHAWLTLEEGDDPGLLPNC